MSDVQTIVREFVTTLNRASELEIIVKDAKRELKGVYDRLVAVCPHAEAVDHKMNIRGWGTWRVCKACGLEDHAIIGATAGDEYNYGYSGRVDETFWAGTEVTTTKNEKEFNSYRKSHGYQVYGGRAVKK